LNSTTEQLANMSLQLWRRELVSCFHFLKLTSRKYGDSVDNTVDGDLQRRLPNRNALVPGHVAVKLCTNKILHDGHKTVVVVVAL